MEPRVFYSAVIIKMYWIHVAALFCAPIQIGSIRMESIVYNSTRAVDTIVMVACNTKKIMYSVKPHCSQ